MEQKEINSTLIPVVNKSAEVNPIELAAILIDLNILNKEDIEFIPLGVNKTITTKVLSGTTYKKDTEKYSIYTNEIGAYDAFPHAFFHPLGSLDLDGNIGDNQKSQEVLQLEKIEKIKQNAKAFFSIFEQVFYQYKIDLELSQRRDSYGLVNCLADFWNLPIWLTARERKLMTYLLLKSSKIRHQQSYLPQIIALLTGYEVEFNFHQSTTYKLLADQAKKIGATILGQDAFLGNSVQIDEEETLNITLKKVTQETLFDYIPKAKNNEINQTRIYQLVQMVVDYFLPVEQEYNIILEAAYSVATFTTSKDKPALLGYSFLEKKT